LLAFLLDALPISGIISFKSTTSYIALANGLSSTVIMFFSFAISFILSAILSFPFASMIGSDGTFSLYFIVIAYWVGLVFYTYTFASSSLFLLVLFSLCYSLI